MEMGLAAPSQELHPALGELAFGNPTNDRFQMYRPIYEVRIFSVSENGENGLGDEGADGGNAHSEFLARTAPGLTHSFPGSGQQGGWIIDS